MSLKALAARVALDPEEPFLFAPSGRDWRWLSWSVAAARVSRLMERLAEAPQGAQVVFEDDLSPDALLLDLAIVGCGRTSRPVRETPQENLPGEVVRVRWREGESGTASAAGHGESLTLERPFHFTSRGPERVTRDSVVRCEPGRIKVDGVGEVSSEEVGRVAAVLADQMPVETRRTISVLSRPLASPLGRVHFAWAIRAGVAVVVAPGENPATIARWARPHVLAGPMADLESRRAAWTPDRPHWDRLAAWLHAEEDAPRKDQSAYWRERGVAIVAAPILEPVGSAALGRGAESVV